MAGFRRNAITFLITFCISFLIFGVLAYIVLSTFFAQEEENKPAQNATVVEIDDQTDPSSITQNSFSILLVGTDNQVPAIAGYKYPSADSIFLLRFSYETNTVVYMSIPAVTKTTVGGSETTLAHAYAQKGIEDLKQKIHAMTGIYINYHAVVSVDGFAKIIDSLNGMNGVDISHTVEYDMQYEDKAQNLKINLKKNDKISSGKQITDMLRYRDYNYEARMNLNHEFITKVIEEFLKLDYKDRAKALLTTVLPNVRTNFSEADLIKYMDVLYGTISPNERIFNKRDEVNFEGTLSGSGDKTVFDPNIEETKKKLGKYKNN